MLPQLGIDMQFIADKSLLQSIITGCATAWTRNIYRFQDMRDWVFSLRIQNMRNEEGNIILEKAPMDWNSDEE